MRSIASVQTIAVLMLGAVSGYLAASGDGHSSRRARASLVPPPERPRVELPDVASPVVCSDGEVKAALLAARTSGSAPRGEVQAPGKKPNILVIFGDDIGIPQIMAGRGEARHRR